MLFVISQVFSTISGICSIIGVQIKEKKGILIFFILGSLFATLGLALLKAYSGAVMCFIGAIQTSINYIYSKNSKELPKKLIASYMVISITAGIVAFKNIIDILPIIGVVLYICSISQRKEGNIRKITMFVGTVWAIYSGIVKAYPLLIANIFVAISAIIAIVRYDFLKKEVVVKN